MKNFLVYENAASLSPRQNSYRLNLSTGLKQAVSSKVLAPTQARFKAASGETMY